MSCSECSANDEKKSLIDELIDLKFPIEEERSPEKISKFLQQLCEEVRDFTEFMESEEGGENEDDHEEFTGRLNRDDFPDDMIPFVVVKRDDLFLDYKCPGCGTESKYAIKRFDKSPYTEYECPDCKKKFLIKLNFEPKLKIYLGVDDD